MVAPSSQRARRTAASAARDAISTAAARSAALLLEEEQEEEEEEGLRAPGRRASSSPSRRRTTMGKRVSYAEVPIDADEVEPPDEGDERVSGPDDDEEEEDADGEVDEDVLMADATDRQTDDLLETASVSSGDATPTTARRNRRSRAPAAAVVGGGRTGKARRKGKAPTSRTAKAVGMEDGAAAVEDEEDVQVVEEPAGTPVSAANASANGAEITQHKVKGILYDVINDEIEMEEDPRGETKVDTNGRLLGGREYKVWTLTSSDRSDPDRLYALSIDIARTVGFSDSSVMLRRLPMLVKVSMTPPEKEQAIEAGKVSTSMRLRSVTMIPIRNVYKYLGAKIVKDGRYVTDDYYEEAAKEECAENGIEPNSLVPDRPFAVEQDHTDRGGAGERSVGAPFYFPGGPTTHWGGAGWNPWHGAGQGNKRAKLQSQGLTRDNWMWRMAREARDREREIREAGEQRMLDFTQDRLAVFHEQYVAEENTQAARPSTKHEEDTTMTIGTVGPAEQGQQQGLPLAQDVAGLFAHDDAFRQRYRQVTHTPSNVPFDEGQLAGEIRDVGSVIVESRAETASRQGRRPIKLKPGVYRGMYEPHTNVPHVRQDLQPTWASMDKIALLPQVETKRSRFRWDPDYTFASTLTLRRIGPSASAVYSLDYAFETSQDEGRDEVVQRERLVREAVEWERQMSQGV
ncbi:hypothetical protein QFC19_009098 [Naganishia cerealis]|uniref:Uncharacterized protein n=1 Tax=Naganishia cerealis TaxID=610337 RepID=A0ACC2UXW2_9TREE|nr:hypothetical protein QFC19_009098 [Naganishia cerealis]